MKALTICGSPRENGNTKRLRTIDRIAENLAWPAGKLA